MLIGAAVGLIFNGFSVNGINPLRKIADVPVITDSEAAEAEGIRYVAIDRVQELIESGHTVIDARSAADFDGGHIPGAILVDYYDLGHYLDDLLPRLSRGEDIVIYCSGPSCDDSELLARELFALGYTKVLVFKGGIEEWEETGLPLQSREDREDK